MSQKIDGTFHAAQTLRSIGTAPRAGVSVDAPARAVDATDSLKLTGEATNLQAIERGLSNASAIDAGRVQAVRESLQNGSYRIDPEAIASRMLDLDRQLLA